MKDKILITGMTGFVGQNLSPYLSKYFEVRGISRKEISSKLAYQKYLEENSPYYAVVHLAGKAHDLNNTSNDSEYYDVNFKLTKQIYNQFLLSDAKQFIYISSVKAAADEVKGILTEEVIQHPITAYGKSKKMSEDYILGNLKANKIVYILRPCMIHGPGNKGNLNLLYSFVSQGFPWPLGAFENRRSFCSIDNLCFVIKELLSQQEISSGVYNVADDVPLSTNEVISILAESTKRKPKIWNISKGLVEFFAKMGNVFKLPLNEERLHKLTVSYVVSNKKLMSAIRKSLPVSSREGLHKTFQSFK